jgi:hypothetical protein
VKGRDNMVENHAPFSRFSPCPAAWGEDSMSYHNMIMPCLTALDIQLYIPLNTEGVRGRDNMVENHAPFCRISPCPAAGGEDSIPYPNMAMPSLTASDIPLCHAPIIKDDKLSTILMAKSHCLTRPPLQQT